MANFQAHSRQKTIVCTIKVRNYNKQNKKMQVGQTQVAKWYEFNEAATQYGRLTWFPVESRNRNKERIFPRRR